MDRYKTFSKADHMAVDLAWVVGRCVKSVEKKDYSWFFTLDDLSIIDTESDWRLMAERILITSQDDGQLFGHESPVNAAKAVETSVNKSAVSGFQLDERTGDLFLNFQNGCTIQFVTLSSGYEGWRVGHGDQCIVCLGGGELAIGPR
ncbi:MAG TPA: DUF6188 family protein [Humisphaera sp.]|jgi:hypothetical protein|nr:DUF6188 family protein [Humisphaera sp.]